MSDEIDITGIDKAVLLAALYNGTRAIGLGRLHDMSTTMQVEEARLHLGRDSDHVSFDYVAGRPIKVAFDGNRLLYASLYDRDAGDGACQGVVDVLKAGAGD